MQTVPRRSATSPDKIRYGTPHEKLAYNFLFLSIMCAAFASSTRSPTDEMALGLADNKSEAAMDLEGKSVVVLGASARGGSGWATAVLARERGAKVVVGARRFEGVTELANEIGGVAVRCDASVEADVDAMAQTAMDSHGGIDIAILAAGVPVVGMLEDLDAATMQSAIANNFLAAHYFIRRMGRRMKSGGAITI
ncbi:MAG: SDR family oxidoreductase, partial [Caulobacterales bacterium]